jgi:UDP-N-acetylglucosamine 1-carboxyvinyltransferase
MPDRNEAISYACAALATKGDVIVENMGEEHLHAFLEKVKEAGGRFETGCHGIRFWYEKPLKATNIIAAPHPSFMTDWQPLWTTLMTQAKGKSEIIETIHEYRLAYTEDLVKMGAKIKFFNPQVKNPNKFYNFNLEDDRPEYFHGARVSGPTPLKGMNLVVPDIRAGATLTLAALIAKGKSTLSKIHHIDRGYEELDVRLRELGADIKRIS